MNFMYFDVSRIFGETEREKKGDFAECLETYETTGFSHRWIQPPVVCYFVTTMDEHGNTNCTPVSMGTAFCAAPPDLKWCFTFALSNDRHARRNLDIGGECVISYYPYTLLRESAITGLPVPDGINEMDIAGLTPLPSHKVKPCGIQECISNLEAKVIERVPVSGSTYYILEVVAVSVQTHMVEKDKALPLEPGLALGDLLYEVSIKGTPPRLNYTRMNYEEVLPTPADIGSDEHWIGTFNDWMEAEERRGKITPIQKKHILELNKIWQTNPDPVANEKVKRDLTDALKEIVKAK
ncbi:MAG: flavin reductase family protein [Christensenellales bacterium]|jgi:flavin reductase (DIM6/NTAB) family NADH-FMN oxidoreductase RutF